MASHGAPRTARTAHAPPTPSLRPPPTPTGGGASKLPSVRALYAAYIRAALSLLDVRGLGRDDAARAAAEAAANGEYQALAPLPFAEATAAELRTAAAAASAAAAAALGSSSSSRRGAGGGGSGGGSGAHLSAAELDDRYTALPPALRHPITGIVEAADRRQRADEELHAALADAHRRAAADVTTSVGEALAHVASSAPRLAAAAAGAVETALTARGLCASIDKEGARVRAMLRDVESLARTLAAHGVVRAAAVPPLLPPPPRTAHLVDPSLLKAGVRGEMTQEAVCALCAAVFAGLLGTRTLMDAVTRLHERVPSALGDAGPYEPPTPDAGDDLTALRLRLADVEEARHVACHSTAGDDVGGGGVGLAATLLQLDGEATEMEARVAARLDALPVTGAPAGLPPPPAPMPAPSDVAAWRTRLREVEGATEALQARVCTLRRAMDAIVVAGGADASSQVGVARAHAGAAAAAAAGAALDRLAAGAEATRARQKAVADSLAQQDAVLRETLARMTDNYGARRDAVEAHLQHISDAQETRARRRGAEAIATHAAALAADLESLIKDAVAANGALRTALGMA